MVSYKSNQSIAVPEVSFHRNSSIDLEIVELESIQHRSKKLVPTPDSPHILAFNLLLMVEQGEGSHLVDFEKIDFKPASILFVNKGQMHSFDFSSQLKGKAIVYTEQFLDRLQTTTSIPFSLSANMPKAFFPCIQADEVLMRSMMRLTDELYNEINRTTPSLEIIISLFSALLMMLARERNYAANKFSLSDTKKFMSFQALIEGYCYTHREAGFYAEKLGMSYKTLNLLSRRVSGKTAKSYIDEHIILEAKRRLSIDQCSIASLAYDLGFKETTNFIKFFKRYTETTPNQFLKKVRN